MQTFKRLSDILLSLIGIIILFPIIPIIGLLIKLDSKGPVFYLVDRVGKNMKIFKMYKFRTMLEVPCDVGESVCAQHDPRVTTFGRLLRRAKLNELPQLFNILKGDMTFVGPRPEAPDLAILYPEEAKKLFTVKPGVVGPATICGRNEEECYPPGVDTKKYYIESILPEKLKLDLEYIEKQTFFKDYLFIFWGIKETIFGTLSKKHIHDNRSQIYLMILDIALMSVSFTISYLIASWKYNLYLAYDFKSFSTFFTLIFSTIVIRFILNIYFNLYSSLIRYISFDDLKRVIISGIFGCIILILIFNIIYNTSGIIALFIIDLLIFIVLLSSVRISIKLMWLKMYRHNSEKKKKRVLIYGACDEGNSACKLLTSESYHNYEIIGFIDDSPNKLGKVINGIKVLGNRYHLKELVKIYKIHEILIAEPNINKDRLNILYDVCQNFNIEIKYFNMIGSINTSLSKNFIPRNLEFSDLLPIETASPDYNAMAEILPKKTILIFGTAGSFGLELCKNFIRIGCKKLIIVDRYESYLNELLTILSKEFFIDKIVPFLFETLDIIKLDEVFKTYKPDIVIHAGMRKYESMFTLDYGNALRSNYTQTFHLVKLAEKYGTNYFILISSLYKGLANSLIQDTLKVSETALKYFFEESKTKFHIVRFSDLVENRGGIVSSIKEQILSQGKVILPSTLNNGPISLTSKYSASKFFLNTINKILANDSKRIEHECDALFSLDIKDIIKRIAFFYGIKNWNNISVEFLNNRSNYNEIIDRRKNKNENLYSSNQNFYLIKNKDQLIKNIFLDFIKNELNINKNQHIRTKDLLKFCSPL